MSETTRRMRAIHPGEVLREEYFAPLVMSAHALAMELGVPATRLHELSKERCSASANAAERLARHFGGGAASWLALQVDYALRTLPTRTDIEREVTAHEAAA